MFKFLKDKQFLRRFIVISLPVMIQNLIAFSVNFLDNVMIGGVSDQAVSAVYASNQVSFFFNVMAWGVISGASIMVQQFYGAKDKNHLHQSFRYKLLISTIFLLITLPLLYFFGIELVKVYAQNDGLRDLVIEEAKRYLPIIFLTYIPFAYSSAYGSTLRETENTKLPMYISGVALLINVIFNYLFIYVFSLGVVGAAYATLLARLVEFSLFIIITKRHKIEFAQDLFHPFHIDKSLFKLITIKMLPLLLNEILWAGGMVMQSLSYAQRGNVLSALSIWSTTTEVFGIVFTSLSIGIGVMMGSTLGANKIEDAQDLAKKSLGLGIFLSVIIGLLLFSVSPFIPKLWVEVNIEQQRLATQMIQVFSLFLWVFSIGIVAYVILRSGGKTTLTMILDSGLMWLGTVPLAWILALWTSLPLIWIYPLLQLVDVVKMILGLIFLKYGKWANNLTVKITKKADNSQLVSSSD